MNTCIVLRGLLEYSDHTAVIVLYELSDGMEKGSNKRSPFAWMVLFPFLQERATDLNYRYTGPSQ